MKYGKHKGKKMAGSSKGKGTAANVGNSPARKTVTVGQAMKNLMSGLRKR